MPAKHRKEGAAASPPPRICATCGRHFEWRRKWAEVWESVRYCSANCRRGPGKAGRELERAILDRLDALPPTSSICPSDIARSCYPEHWREHMEAVRRAARRLGHAGEIEISQGGHAVDPGEFRGPIRLRRRRS